MNLLAKKLILKVLASAGITLNGPAPEDIQVYDQRFYKRVFLGGSLGLGESYVDGWWDVSALDTFFARLLSRDLPAWVENSPPLLLTTLINRLTNFPSWRPCHIGRAHYDIGNDLYEAMLGPTMAYSCAYWKGSRTLDEAQEAKYELACRKLGLRHGQRVLDIGCGWGGLARYAAMHYGVKVTGITVSREQERLARERCRSLDVEIRYQDYRDVRESFDHIVSIGMFEHVGYKNYSTYIDVIRRSLHNNGLCLLHTIGSLRSSTHVDPWISSYVFPDSKIPSLAQIARAVEGALVTEDLENIGADYDRTLMAWWQNFETAWPTLGQRYNERFRRMWRYYLLMCAGIFRSRREQVWQIVLSPNGVTGGYRRPVGQTERVLEREKYFV
ncbi:MAG: cyclopropane fatty acyl phospholipid synthase [Candidatus Omnitrophica bacterium]|nr:cyclopropane fatty acyl phospholipid synthase [Candidatus Omnitrophota bacterium]